MKKLKYILLIFIIFITPNVFAAEINVNQYVRPTINGDTRKYWGLESYNGGLPANYTIGTRYTGRLSKLEYFIKPYGFEYGYTYTITMNMATEDWRNNFGSSYYWDCDQSMTNTNAHVFIPTYVSYKKIKFTFTPSQNTSCLRVLLYSKNQDSSQYFTGTSNWNLSSIIVNDPAYDSSSGGSGGSGGTTDPNQSIINNANENTANIINNQNSNTNDIIDNANENTSRIVNQQEITNQCSKTNILVSSMCYNLSNSNDIECKVPLYANVNYSFNVGTYNWSRVRLYDDTASYLTTFGSGSTGLRQFNFTSVSNTSYGLFTFYPGNNVNVSNVDFSKVVLKCLTKEDETIDYLKDDSNPNISDSEFTDLFNTVGFTDPLGYLLQLPVQFINQLVSQSNTCQTISLGTLWGVSLTLPCIDIGRIIGQQVWDIIDVLFSVGLLVVIFKNLYQTFANLMTMGGEKEAREKFSMPTPMEFLSIILGGDR